MHPKEHEPAKEQAAEEIEITDLPIEDSSVEEIKGGPLSINFTKVSFTPGRP